MGYYAAHIVVGFALGTPASALDKMINLARITGILGGAAAFAFLSGAWVAWMLDTKEDVKGWIRYARTSLGVSVASGLAWTSLSLQRYVSA